MSDKLDCALDLLRRLPPQNVEENVKFRQQITNTQGHFQCVLKTQTLFQPQMQKQDQIRVRIPK